MHTLIVVHLQLTSHIDDLTEFLDLLLHAHLWALQGTGVAQSWQHNVHCRVQL